MNIKDKLGITLTTYNRCQKAKRTLETLLADNSPVRLFDITVQDNNSSDGTPEMVAELQLKHTNLHYRKNPYNLGISGNIAKAMELADKEYHWNICDDDNFSWTGWSELENAISNGEKVICIANYLMKDQYANRFDYQLLQMSFVPGLIIHTSLFTDTTIRNSFDNIFTLFPHLVPIVTFHNAGGTVHTLSTAIVCNGMERTTDCSYLRGARPDVIFQRSRTMTWLVGYSNILANLNDAKLAKECFQTVLTGDHSFRCGYREFLAQCFFTFRGRENKMQVADLLPLCSWPLRLALRLISILQDTPLYHLAVKLQSWK